MLIIYTIRLSAACSCRAFASLADRLFRLLGLFFFLWPRPSNLHSFNPLTYWYTRPFLLSRVFFSTVLDKLIAFAGSCACALAFVRACVRESGFIIYVLFALNEIMFAIHRVHCLQLLYTYSSLLSARGNFFPMLCAMQKKNQGKSPFTPDSSWSWPANSCIVLTRSMSLTS